MRTPYGQQSSDTDDPPLADDPAMTTNAASAIMVELCSGFQAFDSRLDYLNDHLDRMGERIEHNDTRIGKAEERLSTVDDKTSSLMKCLE
ncbi:hypothetical protein NDU88_005919 [Pleurodeles waltl]|uniref:Uncharacterized protein n=1 Tax=Pleurodeles waltl TaxID=8319 RepID=A0AAV7TCT3_PLEWA|nr:hypothetical protein NDU88_005919 [Pleurodeles waltl]